MVARRLCFSNRCSWRRCVSVLSILLVVNTAFHWSLVDDVHRSMSGRLNAHRKTVSRSAEDLDIVAGGGVVWRDRVISINKWYDEVADNDVEHGGKGIAFDDDVIHRRRPEKGPLITYITRKPSNRRPLGEVPQNEKQLPPANLASYTIRNTSQFLKASFASVRPENVTKKTFKSNGSEGARLVEASRSQIEAAREKVRARKREIRNKSRSESQKVDLSFVLHPQTKHRSWAAKTGPGSGPDRARVAAAIHDLGALMNYTVVEASSSEKIRYYSQPGWLNTKDIDAMNFLAGSWVFSRRQGRRQELIADVAGVLDGLLLASDDEIERLLALRGTDSGKAGIFDTLMECERGAAGQETAVGTSESPQYRQRQQQQRCQAAWCLSDLSLVVAFHLDRVIGLNITPQTVARELPVRFRHPPVPRRDSSPPGPADEPQQTTKPNSLNSSSATDDLLPVRVVALTVMTSTIGLHPGHGTARVGPASRRNLGNYTEATVKELDNPTNISEKLLIFCFLLKISQCTVESWTEYFTVAQLPHRLKATNETVFRDGSRNSTLPINVFRPSEYWSDDNDENLLQSFKRLSPASSDLLYAGRIRQRLLQSLFIDRVFWNEAGGRRGIETLLDVIEGRVKELSERLRSYEPITRRRMRKR